MDKTTFLTIVRRCFFFIKSPPNAMDKADTQTHL